MAKSVTRIKLLIVVPTLECGGLERNVSIISNNIDTSKYDVTLAVLNNAKQFFKITNPDVKVIDLKINNVRMSLFAILKLARKLRPAIILTTANHLNLFLAIFKWMFSRKIKIIARESSIVSVNTQRTWNPRIYHWLLRTFYKKTDLIICQSEYMQADLLKNYNIKREQTRIIYNPVLTVQTPCPEDEQKPFVKFISVGRLSPEKGFDRLIRAVSLLKIPYQFTIIGEGRMRPILEQTISDLSLQQQVILAGRKTMPFSEVTGVDLFLMGSHYEGFPNAMLEATALGIPVVAFNAPGGIAELLVNKQNGILVEGNEEAVFATAIQQALDHPFDKKGIREATLQRFNINAVMERWDKVFEEFR
ncbi:glycosyltransferase [soil metagenome]